MALDYDQILAKRPASEDAIFAWCVALPHNLQHRRAANWQAQTGVQGLIRSGRDICRSMLDHVTEAKL